MRELPVSDTLRLSSGYDYGSGERHCMDSRLQAYKAIISLVTTTSGIDCPSQTSTEGCRKNTLLERICMKMKNSDSDIRYWIIMTHDKTLHYIVLM